MDGRGVAAAAAGGAAGAGQPAVQGAGQAGQLTLRPLHCLQEHDSKIPTL